MVVGKTRPTLSKTEIFSKVSEAQVLSIVLPEVTVIPCLICSPLRNDSHPSFSIFLKDDKHIKFKDHATKESGGLLDLLCRYWKCSFAQCLDKICALMLTDKKVVVNKQIKTLTRKEKDSLSKIQVAVRPWREYDLKYWESYGITKKWLIYADIFPISHKIVTVKDTPKDKGKRYIFTADKYAYAFVERKEGKVQLKIYQPFNANGYKWCSKMDGSVIGLWTKIPQKGDRVVICSSLKDALVLSCQCKIPTLCLQGEGYNMSERAIRELKERFDKVFICFDTDAPGIADGKKLSEETGFINIIPDLGKKKDLSDYYKSLENKEDFQQIKQLFK